LLPTVTINRRAAERLAAGHVWIYSSDIADRGQALGGDVVNVLDPRGRPCGAAHFSSSSQITLRLLGKEFSVTGRIAAAQAFRDRVVRETNAYRLVSSEADQMPALIIDRYDDCFVVQTLNQGMDRLQPEIVAALVEQYSPRAIVERNDAVVRQKEELPLRAGVVQGELSGPVAVTMNGLQFEANLLGGQKTGVYLDQRENYVAAARWGRGKALDCFTSSGGFALHLARGCESVEGVDSGAAVLATAEANRQRNGFANIRFREADVFDLLAGFRTGGRQFDTMVLDPPAFAKSKAQIDGALRGYKELNLRGLQLLAPGGTLITCSCSHHISEAMLFEAVAEAARDARRSLRVLERRVQAQDHPILLSVPETLYLKCLIFEAL
jgi:23S rRNA (cytosine1962-C5)-methyltransferase